MPKYFDIVPNGIIKGGNFEYEFHADKRLLTYKSVIKVGKWGMSKSFDAAGHQNIEPEQLESAKYNTVGAKIEFANLKGTITKVGHMVAHAQISMNDMEVSGTAQFDISGKYVALITLDAHGRERVPVLGKVDFRLIIQPAIKPLAKKDVVVPVEEPKQEAGENGEVQQKES